MNRERLIVETADRLAEEAHRGIKRKNSDDDYIVHPRRVRERVIKRVSNFCSDLYLYEAVALGHDAKEDNRKFYDEVFVPELSKVANGAEMPVILKAINAITKSPKATESYILYLTRVKSNEIARQVKICDLEDNMSDLKPCNLLDKYELTYWYLLNSSTAETGRK